jgi:hypothetical protein
MRDHANDQCLEYGHTVIARQRQHFIGQFVTQNGGQRH